MPLANHLPACNSPSAGLEFALLGAADRRRWQCWCHTTLRVWLGNDDDILHRPSTATENLVKCSAGIGREMEPIGDLGGAIVQQIDRPMPLEVNEQRAIATNATPGAQRQIIHSQHARRGHACIERRVQQPEQRIRAGRYACLPCQTCTAFTARL